MRVCESVHTQQGVCPVLSEAWGNEDDSRLGVTVSFGSCPYLGAPCWVGGR